MTTRRDELKAKLLEKYAGKEPSTFLQYDGFDDMGADSYNCPDSDGDSLWSTTTQELMSGFPAVRILITAGTSQKTARRLLKKLRRCLKDGGDFPAWMQGAEVDDMSLDSETCPRCGSDKRQGHHALCRYPDGTSTPLTDEAVREALAVLGSGGGGYEADSVDDIPF